MSRHVHFHHTTSCYLTIDCVYKKVRGTREYFAMDYPLQLDKFSSAHLADTIVYLHILYGSIFYSHTY